MDDFNGPTVTLRRGKARALWHGHPWLLAHSVYRVEEGAEDGAVVRVVDGQGQTIDFGFLSTESAIRVRLLGIGQSWPGDWPSDALPESFWRRRLVDAQRLRASFGLPKDGVTDAYRLLNSEGDFTPGFIVDIYGAVAVVHVTTAPAWQRREALFDALERVIGVSGIHVQSSERIAGIEGFPVADDVARGEVPDEMQIVERGVRYRVRPGALQKTGHYLDQRENRVHFGALASDARVLDAYCFAGAFALHAALGGASEVLGVDSSADAIDAARENAQLNGVEGAIRWRKGRVERVLAELADRGKRFDLISLDPPKLAPTRKSEKKAIRKYEALCEQAFGVLSSGGLLLVSSCSSRIGPSELTRALAAAAGRARRPLRVCRVTQQPPDHPYPAGMAEGRYLTAVLVRA